MVRRSGPNFGTFFGPKFLPQNMVRARRRQVVGQALNPLAPNAILMRIIADTASLHYLRGGKSI